MKAEIKNVLFFIGVGAMLVTYVNASQKDFIKKDLFDMLIKRLDRIENKIDKLNP